MKDYSTLEKNLKGRGFAFRAFETKEAAAAYLDEKLDGREIGMGASMTLRELGLYEKLKAHNEVSWHMEGGEIARANAAQTYISSLNALAETGELINIDGVGNRISATAFGPEYLYFVVGKNKLAESFDAALWRARNVAAPKNAARFKAQTPCVLEQPTRCHDCNSPDRICRELLVHWMRPRRVKELEVILIEEDLGY